MEIYTAKLVDGFRSILSLFIFSLFVLKMKKNIFASWAEAQVLFGRIVVFMFSLLMFDSSPSDVMSWMLVMPTLTFTRWRQICFCCSASVPHTHTHTHTHTPAALSCRMDFPLIHTPRALFLSHQSSNFLLWHCYFIICCRRDYWAAWLEMLQTGRPALFLDLLSTKFILLYYIFART